MHDARGFSLLELLVALAILAAAVWSIAQVAVYTARSSEVSRRLTLGAELAASGRADDVAAAVTALFGVAVPDAAQRSAPKELAG